MIDCDRVFVSIAHSREGVAQLTLPAFTVTPDDLKARVHALAGDYFRRAEGQPVSLADFALYAVHCASLDPFEQPEP